MHILIAGSTYSPSTNGQAIFTVNLAERLAARGHHVTAMFPARGQHPYQSELHGVHLEHTRSTNFSWIHENVWIPSPRPAELRAVFDRAQPDIVHIQDHYPPAGAILREARRRGIRLIGTNHYMPENIEPYVPLLPRVRPLFNWLAWHWMLSIYNHCEVVTTQSRAAAELVRAAGLRPPVFPVSCGIDLKRFHPDPATDRSACRLRHGLDPARKVFLFVGRADGEKRVDLLLRALKRLGRDDVQLAVAGVGAALSAWKSLARSLGLGDRVRFLGFVPNEDLHILLNSVDVFVMPSPAELLSIATLEAMACGRPVLLADAVALPELCTPGVNGYLFKPGDPADAARCMTLLADHPEQWEQMGRASAERAQEHGLERTISRYEELYNLRLAGGAAKRPAGSHSATWNQQ